MPAKIAIPLIIPASEEVVCDDFLIRNMCINYDITQDRYSAEVTLWFFKANDDGTKTFHKDVQGNITNKNVSILDLYGEAGLDQKLGKAIMAILDACGSRYDKMVEPLPVPEPVEPPPAPEPEELKKK